LPIVDWHMPELSASLEGVFRERFLGMLAHDLRQPLNTFIFANRTLAATASTSAPVASLLGMQHRAAERMTRMVADLLDFSRSRPETGMPVEREWVDFERVDRRRHRSPRAVPASGPVTRNQ
jgi:signal transduction histidine kinase